jgi:hypothetical protein
MLAAFREATRRAATSGKHTEAVKEAQALLADGCREVAWFCDVDEFTTLLDVDGFPSLRRTEDMRWQKLQSFRQRMAGLFVALGE